MGKKSSFFYSESQEAEMTEAIHVAEEHDVTLTIEPEVSNIVHTARKARRLLDEIKSPHLKVTFDGANIYHKGELPRMQERKSADTR